MNENEKISKDSKFNLIIGVSSLLIALLGATFAYFTINSGSEENDVKVRSAFVDINYTGGSKIQALDLIPTSEDVMLWAYKERVKETHTVDGKEETYQCIDAQEKSVCSVYQFTLESDADGAVTNLTGKIQVNTNEFIKEDADGNPQLDDEGNMISGLSYIVYELTQDESGNTVYTKVSGGSTQSENTTDIASTNISDSEKTFQRFGIPSTTQDEEGNITTVSIENNLFGNKGRLEITNKVKHYYELVIWLHDDGKEQNEEQNKLFEATLKVNVNSGDNTNGIISGSKE